MNKRVLGRTGIEVTELCFGALPMGPLQKNLPAADAAEVVAAALIKGVNFVDTAQRYRTYEPIRMAMEQTGIRPVLATKSDAKTYEDMQKAVEEALAKLGVDYIDIFHLHAARGGLDVYEERAGALKCLLDYKAKGVIRAVGISTHDVRVAKLTADKEEIDILFPIINQKGLGILNGSVVDMLAAIESNAAAGKGIYLMKVLAGGSLINEYEQAITFAQNIKGAHAISVGMVSVPEVEFNVAYFNGVRDFEQLPTIEKYVKRFYPVELMCIGCQKCAEMCHSNAISFKENGKAEIDPGICLQCGYCVSACPQFAIRVI